MPPNNKAIDEMLDVLKDGTGRRLSSGNVADRRDHSAGRFTIDATRWPRFDKALTRRTLGLRISGHAEGAGLAQVKPGENPDYILPSTRVGEKTNAVTLSPNIP